MLDLNLREIWSFLYLCLPALRKIIWQLEPCNLIFSFFFLILAHSLAQPCSRNSFPFHVDWLLSIIDCSRKKYLFCLFLSFSHQTLSGRLPHPFLNDLEWPPYNHTSPCFSWCLWCSFGIARLVMFWFFIFFRSKVISVQKYSLLRKTVQAKTCKICLFSFRGGS